MCIVYCIVFSAADKGLLTVCTRKGLSKFIKKEEAARKPMQRYNAPAAAGSCKR